jgi:copper transport protein
MRRRLRVPRRQTILRAIVAASFLVVLAGEPAAAHAGFVSSDPAAGAVLQSAPAAITIHFTEPPDVSLSSIEVLDSGGITMPAGALSAQPNNGLRLDLPGGLPTGGYTVVWKVISAADGHFTADTFAFGVGAPPAAGGAPPVEAESGVSPLAIASKALLYSGLMMLFALAVVGLGAFGGRLRWLPQVAVLSAAAAAIGAALFLVAEQRTVGVAWNEFLRSDTGHWHLWLLGVTVVAAVLAAVFAARPARGMGWALGAMAAIAMLVRAVSGHAAGSTSLPTFEESLQWVHLMAAGAWGGGIVLLVLLLRERRRDGTGSPVGEARRFSTLAFFAVGFVVASGTLRALNELAPSGGILHVFATSYGTTLTIKVVFALVLIGLGAVNRYRNMRRLDVAPSPLRRIATTESVVALGVVLLTATLTGLSPQPTSPAVAAPLDITASGSDFGTTTRAELTAAPGTPGPNTFNAHVLGYDSGTPVAADQVTLRFDSVTQPSVGATSLQLTQDGDVWTAQGSQLSLAGTWSVSLLARTGGQTVQVPLVLITRQEGTTQQTIPGSPAVTTTTYPDGSSIQAYTDPGTSGTNQVHVTAFDPNGGELAVKQVTIVAVPPDGPPQRLDFQRFSAGHGVGTADLTVGDWTFDIVASAGRSTMQATYAQAIAASTSPAP